MTASAKPSILVPETPDKEGDADVLSAGKTLERGTDSRSSHGDEASSPVLIHARLSRSTHHPKNAASVLHCQDESPTAQAQPVGDNKIAIAEAGGIERLMAALSTHAGHAGVAEKACGTLYNIGRSDRTLQHSIKDAGAEELLRAAVARSNATAETKEKGRKLLNKLIKL